MARVFLLNPPTDEPVKSPLLSFCYLAASLRRAGHVVALLDSSAPFAPKSHAAITEHVAAFEPDLVGIHTKTLYARDSYAVAAALKDRFTLVAGGPHATVCPDEPFRFGFRYVVRGEGEETLVELADAIDGRRSFDDIRSLSVAGPLGPKHHASRGFLRELDAIAPPVDAIDLFDPGWYGHARAIPPVGLLSSRGCPAACTFCSNNVTGRQFRYRSADDVAHEVARIRDAYGATAFSFFDDSFAVGQRRMEELCAALEAHAPGVKWTCTAHPSHLDPETLRRMKAAGCGGIDIGMESGDPEVLLRIGKGVTVERVLEALRAARAIGIHTVLNIMFGWPDETVEQLRTTLRFMERAAPLAGGFNARGVLVPYPGTEIYDRHHATFGFTDWWIREAPLRYVPFPTEWDLAEVKRAYADDPALDRNFFRHPPEVLAVIREGLQLKADHTFRIVERMLQKRPATTVPAAGAR